MLVEFQGATNQLQYFTGTKRMVPSENELGVPTLRFIEGMTTDNYDGFSRATRTFKNATVKVWSLHVKNQDLPLV